MANALSPTAMVFAVTVSVPAAVFSGSGFASVAAPSKRTLAALRLACRAVLSFAVPKA